MLIRPAAAVDATAIGALKVRAWCAAYATFLPADLLATLDPDAEARDWANYLATMPAAHRLWVADDDQLVGFCRTGPADNDPDLGGRAAEIYGLYVEPDRIGTGVGRALFGHAVTDLRSRGFSPLCVYAYTPNRQAIRFYQQAGFALDGTSRLDQHDGTGVTEVRLVAGQGGTVTRDSRPVR